MTTIKNLFEKSGIIAAALVLLASQVVPVLAMPSSAGASHDDPRPPERKVTICHALGQDNKDEWQKIEVNASAIDGSGGGDHNRSGHQDGEDIIPPFYTNGDTGNWSSRNWDSEGQAIFRNDCEGDKPDPTTVQVVKMTDDQNGKFDLYIDGTRVLNNQGNNSTSEKVEVDPSKNVVVLEKPWKSGESLSGYTTSIVCENQDQETVGTGNPTGSTSRQLTLQNDKIDEGDSVVCTFTNNKKVRKGTLIVEKVIVSRVGGTNDPSDFSFTVNRGDSIDFEPDGSNSMQVEPGKYTVVEDEARGYKTTYEGCSEAVVREGQTAKCVISNTAIPPELYVRKKAVNDNGGTMLAPDFNMYVNEVLQTNPDIAGDNAESTATYKYPDAKAGVSYKVTEDEKHNYSASDVSCVYVGTDKKAEHPVTLRVGQRVACQIVNNDKKPAQVIATKVVCNDESLLPNYGSGGPDMTALTAAMWVAENDGCELAEGWGFQWANGDQSNPGDNEYDGGAGWTGFGPTDATGKTSTTFSDLSDVEKLWFREQLPSGYLEYTYNEEGQSNSNDVSAEFYCHNDVLNYDNFDFIKHMEYGNVYNCVAWNVQYGRLVIEKKIINNDGGQATYTQFGVEVDGEKHRFNKEGQIGLKLLPGVYGVDEITHEGYRMVEKLSNCEKVVVRPGETTKCMIVNDDKPAVVRVVKNTNPCKTEQMFEFDITDSSEETQSLKVASEGCRDYVDNLQELETNKELPDNAVKVDAGIVTVVENTPKGWFERNMQCYKVVMERNEKVLEERNVGYGGMVPVRHPIQAENGQRYVCKFMNVEKGKIRVTKFNDLNNNGEWDEDEPTLPDWTINLDRERRCMPEYTAVDTRQIVELPNPVEDDCEELFDEDSWTKSKETDEAGNARFMVRPGVYTVSEDLKDGWEQTVIDCERREKPEIVREEQLRELVVDEYTNGHYQELENDQVRVRPGGRGHCIVGNYEVPAIAVSAVSECGDNFPYVRWNVEANFTPTEFELNWYTVAGNAAGDPADVLVTTQTFAPGDSEVTYDAVTDTYEGLTLWPGADPDVPSWPGYVQEDGQWVFDPTSFGANLRPDARIEFSVNPTESATVSYPTEEGETCDPENPQVLAASTTTETEELADTGSIALLNMFIGLLLIGSVGIAARSTVKISSK